MKKSNKLPLAIQEKTAKRLEELRLEKHWSKDDAAHQIGVTRKTYHEWESGKTIERNGKSLFYYPAITSDNLFALSNLYNVSIDYLLGFSNFRSPQTGLSDKAISGIISIKKESESWKRNTDAMLSTPGYNDMAILNFFLEQDSLFSSVLREFQNYVHPKYKIPIFYDQTTHCFNIPKSDFDVTPSQKIADAEFPETRWLNLAKSESNPFDFISIALTNNFFESVSLKRIEEAFN